jgi:hypothetical protein
MSGFELEVVNLRGSWVVKLDGRAVSGSATRTGAERVAWCSAQSLVRSGHHVTLRTPGAAATEMRPVMPAAKPLAA